MIEKLEKVKKEIERAGKQKKVVTHTYPDLDNLCACYLLLKKFPDIEVLFTTIDDWQKKKDTEYKEYVPIDMEGAILDHHDISGPYSTCKLIYQILYEENPELFEIDFKLVDYCDRADRGQLLVMERQQSSLIHTIYALRSQKVSAKKLLSIFIQLADRIRENPGLLNSMCDIVVSSIDPSLAEKLARETLSFDEIYLKFVRFVKVGDWLIALNSSNHNITSNIFKTFKNCVAIIYSSPNGNCGIILRKPISRINELCNELNKKFSDLRWTVVREGMCIRSASLKDLELTHKPSCEDILLIFHKFLNF